LVNTELGIFESYVNFYSLSYQNNNTGSLNFSISLLKSNYSMLIVSYDTLDIQSNSTLKGSRIAIFTTETHL
jgi:hypothetical protein